MRDGEASTGTELEAAQLILRRLLDEADRAATDVVARVDDLRRDHADALTRELVEVEELRHAMLERLQSADERFGAAQRLVETSRARLAEVDILHAEANHALATATENAAAMIAGVEGEVDAVRARARSDADIIVREAEAEARRIIDDAASYRRDAEVRAADTLGTAQVRAEQVIKAATERRHAGVIDLQQREREIEERIQALLADRPALDRLGVVPERRDAAAAPDVIDLTEGVGDAIRSVIDRWTERRPNG
ncbi:MAG: hypothetical protein AAGF91_11360 [Actinomycetota bacterium]